MRVTRRGVAAAAIGLVCTVAAAAGAQVPPADPFALDGPLSQGGFALGSVPIGTTALSVDGTPIPFAADGRFLVAFDRDAGPAAVLTATLRDGRTVQRTLVIAPRAWDISRLNRLPKYPVPSAEFTARRPAELVQIRTARATDHPSDGWRQQFAWPVTGRISTRFGSQRIYAGEPGAYHSGIDIARPVGTVVRAPADGVVTLVTAAPFTLEGNLVLIDHGMGLGSALMHLSRIDVRVGEKVKQGQPIGLVGATGRATGPHLHWGLTWRGARIDPLLVAGPMPTAH